MNNKTYLFIDGSNLYGSQFKLFGPNNYLDFLEFIKSLEEQVKVKFNKIYFYASYSPKSSNPNKKEKEYLRNEALFYRSVKELAPRLEFFKGYRSRTSHKEKEVDVKLTADFISFAFLNRFDTAYLMTGDADFLQAIFNIQKYHNRKKIYLLCMENNIMYKGAHYFKTFVLKFKNNKLEFHDGKKIVLLTMNSEEMVKSVV